MNFLESMGLRVKKPMKLFIDNKGAINLYNSWSVSGNTRHMATGLAYIRELKEQGLLEILWINGDDNEVNMFTKNVDGSTHNKHCKVYMTTSA